MKRESIIDTANGKVRGTRGGNVETFFGIPYAAPPVGSFRWRPPAAALPWPGVLDASTFGADPMQRARPSGSRAASMSEDCLTLNIWAPVDRAPKRPVMVWFFGGSFTSGSASDAMTDGAVFARDGVVFVSVNSRVGIFGWLSHSGLMEESPHKSCGNYGLLDQIAALRWIRENIENFGGDPERVTIFGVSSGGASVSMLITSPLAAGLFGRAILQSPGSYRPLADRAMAAKAGDVLGTLDDLRGLSEAAVLALEPKLVPAVRRLTAPTILRPIIDGWVLPQGERQAYESGAFNPVRAIVGSNADEGSLLTAAWPIDDIKGFEQLVEVNFSADPASCKALYPVAEDKDARRVLADLFADTQFQLGAREVARAIDTTVSAFRYIFMRPRGGVADGPHHGGELPYVFGHLRMYPVGAPDIKVDDRDRVLSAAFRKAWVDFATTGDPGVVSDGVRWLPACEGILEFGKQHNW